MRQGQGSLEYLMILAAILAIAVVVILTANYLLGAPQEASSVQQDKYDFAVNGFEVRGYDKPLNPMDPSTVPDSFVKDDTTYFYSDNSVPEDAEYAGNLTDSSGNDHAVYYSGGGGGSNGNYYLVPGPVSNCNNTVLDPGEECDPPVDVCLPPYEGNCTYCDAECNNVTLEGGYCSDNNIDSPEECDPPEAPCEPGYDETCVYCGDDCLNVTVLGSNCGDGVIDPIEECDNATLNGVACTPPYEGECVYCGAGCTVETVMGGECGDSVCDPEEDCSCSDCPCGVDEECDAGVCVCADVCAEGNTRCSADNTRIESCEDHDSDGCLEWGEEEYCGTNTCYGSIFNRRKDLCTIFPYEPVCWLEYPC